MNTHARTQVHTHTHTHTSGDLLIGPPMSGLEPDRKPISARTCGPLSAHRTNSMVMLMSGLYTISSLVVCLHLRMTVQSIGTPPIAATKAEEIKQTERIRQAAAGGRERGGVGRKM